MEVLDHLGDTFPAEEKKYMPYAIQAVLKIFSFVCFSSQFCPNKKLSC